MEGEGRRWRGKGGDGGGREREQEEYQIIMRCWLSWTSFIVRNKQRQNNQQVYFDREREREWGGCVSSTIPGVSSGVPEGIRRTGGIIRSIRWAFRGPGYVVGRISDPVHLR